MPFVFCVRSRLELGSTRDYKSCFFRIKVRPYFIFIGIIKEYTRGVPGRTAARGSLFELYICPVSPAKQTVPMDARGMAHACMRHQKVSSSAAD